MAGLAMVWRVTRVYGLAGFTVGILGQFVNIRIRMPYSSQGCGSRRRPDETSRGWIYKSRGDAVGPEAHKGKLQGNG